MNVLRPEPAEDPHAYWQLLRDAWATGEPFAIVEVDVDASDAVLQRFESCPEPWCFNSYPVPADAHGYAPVDPGCGVTRLVAPEQTETDVLGVVVRDGNNQPVIRPAVTAPCSRPSWDHPIHELGHPCEPSDLSCVWCGLPEHAPTVGVEIADLGGAALGCSRFRPASLPDVFAHDMLAGAVHWANLDVHISTVLRLAGHAPHRHFPNVAHSKVRGGVA